MCSSGARRRRSGCSSRSPSISRRRKATPSRRIATCSRSWASRWRASVVTPCSSARCRCRIHDSTPSAVCARRSPPSRAIARHQRTRATSAWPPRSRARRRSRLGTSCLPARCARFSSRSARRGCRRTTFTVVRPSCSCRGPSSSDALAGSSERTIPVICGPTAAGKTQLALWLAARTDVTIVSADSRQLYCGFDIGTAKPTAAERRAVPHCGIDVLDPTQRASAAWWADEADAWIRDALAAGRVPMVVGGTGLYLRALFGSLFAEPMLDEQRRAALQPELGAKSTETLRRWVTELDPPRAALGRTQLLRALEIALLTGRRVSDLHRERHRPARWAARYLVVDPGPELAQRIEA